MLSNSKVAQSLFFRSRRVCKIFYVQGSIFIFAKNTIHVQLCIWDNKILVVQRNVTSEMIHRNISSVHSWFSYPSHQCSEGNLEYSGP